MHLNGEPLGALPLFEYRNELLINSRDLPPGALDDTALHKLQRYSLMGCDACLMLSDLGNYREDTRSGAGYLELRPALMPSHRYRLHKPREAAGKHLQRGLAFTSNLNLSVRDATDSETAYAAIAQSRLSLGVLGVLDSGLRFVDDGTVRQSRRLPLTLTNHFVDAQISYELGEVRTDADPNDGTLGITGFRVYRNFATRPDLTSRPLYDFYALAERPSVIELYQNSQLIRREQIRQPGPVQLEDYRPSGSGKVVLLLRDALGSQRLVETDLFVDQRNLGAGVWDFSLAAGYLRDRDYDLDKHSKAGSLRVAVGLTDNLTLGVFGERAEYDPLSDNYQGLESVWNGGVNMLWSSAVGQFDLSGKKGRSNPGNEFSSYQVNWRKGGSLGRRAHYSVGAGAFRDDEDFSTLGGRERSLEGWRAFAGLNFRSFYLSGNRFDTGDVRGYGVGLGWRWGRLSIDASVQALDETPELYSLSFAWYFGGAVSAARLGAQTREAQKPVESFMDVRGRNQHNTVNWRAQAFHNDFSHSNRGTVGLNWQPDYLNLAYEYRRVEDQREQLADLTFGVGVVPGAAFYVGRFLTAQEGLALVDTELPGQKVTVDGRSEVSNRHGKALLPVRGFGRHFATLDTANLPATNLLASTHVEVSTVPGQSSRAGFQLNAPAAFIQVSGAAVGEEIEVNGQTLRVYEFGAYAENLRLGHNEIRHQQHRYTLDIKSFDESLPTYFVEGKAAH